MARIQITLMALAVICAGPLAAAPSPQDVLGSWVAEPEFAGSRGEIGLDFTMDEDGGLVAAMALPPVGAFDVPIGKARLDGDRLITGLGEFFYVAGSLTGVLPAAIVPVHEIPVTFRRGDLSRQPAGQVDDGKQAQPLWTFSTAAPVYGSPAVAGPVVYIGSDDGRLYALDADTGRQRWRFETAGPVRAKPAVAGGRVFVPSDDGRLYCLEAGSGDLVWSVVVDALPARRTQAGTPEYRYDNFASAARVHGGSLYVGTLAGDLVSLDPETGEERWRFQAGGAITSTPTLSGERVLFGSFDGNVYAVDAVSGELAWRFDTGAPVVSSPGIHDNLVIIGSRSYELFGLDAADGSIRWRFYDWFSWVESSATIADRVAYIGSSDAGKLRALRASDGEVIWSFDTPGSPWGTPAVSDDRVFIGSVGVRGYFIPHEPGFFAVDRDTGRPTWWFPVDQPEDEVLSGFVSSPATDGVRVYVGGLDGKVYGFAVEP